MLRGMGSQSLFLDEDLFRRHGRDGRKLAVPLQSPVSAKVFRAVKHKARLNTDFNIIWVVFLCLPNTEGGWRTLHAPWRRTLFHKISLSPHPATQHRPAPVVIQQNKFMPELCRVLWKA